tara:strand:+ start:495 stop:797 length:303 start_codon:yes stop_codon:yes gene_type:complete
MKPGHYKREDKNFNSVLKMLREKYFHNGGGADAEVIVNWNKLEAKEDGVIGFYATNSALANAIKRCRPGIRAIDLYAEGATLYFDLKAVRPLHTVLKVMK